MAGPPLNQFAQDLYDRLEPVQAGDDQRGSVLACICGAIGIMYDEVEQLVRARPGRQPWQQAFDINESPDFHIPWLGQCIGVRVTPGIPADLQRAQVRADAGFYRGGVDSLVSAIQQTQTGLKRVVVYERYTGDAWKIHVSLDPADTPDFTAAQNAGEAAKVAGLLFTVSSSSVPLFDEGTLIPDTLSSSILFDTATLADIT